MYHPNGIKIQNRPTTLGHRLNGNEASKNFQFACAMPYPQQPEENMLSDIDSMLCDLNKQLDDMLVGQHQLR